MGFNYKHWVCERKKRYRTANKARYVAAKASIKAGFAMNAYRCEFCSYWHIGHKDTTRKKLPNGSSLSWRRQRARLLSD